MTRWLLGSAFGVLAILVSATVARADNACWHLVLGAIAHDAAASHPPYITYSENVDIAEDGQRFLYYDVDVVYHDNGVAYIDDKRWGRPFVTDQLDPGPPVLGPYSDARRGWLPTEMLVDGRLETIASVENIPHLPCTDRGDETIEGVRYAHLVLGVADESRPSVKEIWINRQSLAIPRLIVSGYLLYQNYAVFSHALTDFQIDMQSVDGHQVVRSARWTSYVHWYDQTSKFEATYSFYNYGFTASDAAPRHLIQSSQSTFSSPRPRL